jgi:plastocyanin domain-containing protein
MKRATSLLCLLMACAPEPSAEPAVPTPAQALPEEAVPEASGRVAITVDGMGFHPATIHARTGQPLELVFTRVSEAGCAQELIVPSLGVRKPLPMNQAVSVRVTPTSELRFACGMDMLRGHVVVHGAGAP